MLNKNYSQWNCHHYTWDDLNHFEKGWNQQEGIHSIAFGPTQPALDIYVNDSVSSTGSAVQPIFFNAAISKRSTKSGPFFSGIGLCKRGGLPLISISDPSVDNNNEINLAWYTGGSSDNLTQNLAALFEILSRLLGRELLFVGGSGGGFAALAASASFDGDSSVLVWNPQTDIYEYDETIVKKYLRSIFNFSHASLLRSDWKSFCRSRTDLHCTTSLITKGSSSDSKRFVYLQNTEDWHLSKHLTPLWSKLSKSPLREGKNYIGKNILIYVEQFAEGHAPPSEVLIKKTISQLMDPSKRVDDISFS
ncbi:hypothetical protein ACT3UA_16235 [Glutamicibacter sp. 363]|uniref:hypothetical protein n=1 Tax=Glutamicibacter sp. 363 TaxID=3457731 RepID=UPI0040336489